jgi:hypothetical protein
MNGMWFLNNPVGDENYCKGERFFAPTGSVTIMRIAVDAQKNSFLFRHVAA